MNLHNPLGMLLKLLNSLIFKVLTEKRVLILVLRGGLGNQLYQLSALSYFARKYSAVPFVFDFDITLDSRNRNRLLYRELNVFDWFDASTTQSKLNILNKFDESILRFILRINRWADFIKFYTEADLCNLTETKGRVMFLRDSFQNKKYPLSLPSDFHLKFFSPKHLSNSFDNANKAGVHIRLLDFLPDNPFDYDYYHRAISKLNELELAGVHFYSDDISHAKKLLRLGSGLEHEWPEENSSLNALEFLAVFSKYDWILASKSSLCWWASFLAWKNNPNLFIIHPWDVVEDFRSSM